MNTSSSDNFQNPRASTPGRRRSALAAVLISVLALLAGLGIAFLLGVQGVLDTSWWFLALPMLPGLAATAYALAGIGVPPSALWPRIAVTVGGLAAAALSLVSLGLPYVGILIPPAVVLYLVIAAGPKRELRRSFVAVWLGLLGAACGGFGLLMLEGLRGLHGRPFRIRGRKSQAAAGGGGAWAEPDLEPRLEGLDSTARAALAEGWLADALAEHASIAAFSRLSLELLAAGAPPELLHLTHRAALDEVRHARLTFALASAYAGRPLTAGTFPEAVEPGRSRPPRDRAGWLSVLAVESLQDGVLGEGAAAMVAEEARQRAVDPAVQRALAIIARDEARHTELAWNILGWCLAEGGDPVAAAVAEVLDRPAAPCALSFEAAGELDAVLAGHGRLPEARIQALQQRLCGEALERLAALPRLQAYLRPVVAA